MKNEFRAVVIGGGVVGASVLYHLTKAGWKDVVLLERRELTAGSTWHAAGGMHTLNGDPNVARLQQYTINLYEEIEKVSGQSCSIHLCGGLMLADTEDRMDFLRMAVARGRYLGMELEMITPNEARDLFPQVGWSRIPRRCRRALPSRPSWRCPAERRPTTAGVMRLDTARTVCFPPGDDSDEGSTTKATTSSDRHRTARPRPPPVAEARRRPCF